MLVQLLLVDQAGLLVEGDDHRLKAVWLDVGPKMLGDVGADAIHALGGLDQHSHLGCSLGQQVPVQVGQPAGQLGVGLVDGLLVDVQFHQARFKV